MVLNVCGFENWLMVWRWCIKKLDSSSRTNCGLCRCKSRTCRRAECCLHPADLMMNNFEEGRALKPCDEWDGHEPHFEEMVVGLSKW